jgi:thiosulfate dehydrogenase (quinone) large subunit
LGSVAEREPSCGIVNTVRETDARPRSVIPGMPPRGWLLAGWALLPLRAFLAFTFVFAGLQKLANPAFFNSSSPYSLHQMMIGYARQSPIHFLITPLVRYSTAVGLVIALGELAVGIGMALGLWTRIAALGGSLIALSLFLAVSFHASPWYTGADIVFLFAFSPFVVAGSGGVLSVDSLVARRLAKESHLDDPRLVVLDFGLAQRSCGNFHKGRCNAVANRICAPEGCPWLENVPASPEPRGDEMHRRAVVLGGVAALGAATLGAIAAGVDAGVGRLAGASAGASTSQNSLPPPTDGGGGLGTLIGTAANVPIGVSGTFTVPNGSGDPGLVIQTAPEQFVAYDAVCPHEGCTVAYQPTANLIVCPCHGSEFEVANGDVVRGPAPHGLTALAITDQSGKLYVK